MLGLKFCFFPVEHQNPLSQDCIFLKKKNPLYFKNILICNNFAIMGTNKSIPEQTENPPDVSWVPEVFDG